MGKQREESKIVLWITDSLPIKRQAQMANFTAVLINIFKKDAMFLWRMWHKIFNYT